jgi:hypothetical protein
MISEARGSGRAGNHPDSHIERVVFFDEKVFSTFIVSGSRASRDRPTGPHEACEKGPVRRVPLSWNNGFLSIAHLGPQKENAALAGAAHSNSGVTEGQR